MNVTYDAITIMISFASLVIAIITAVVAIKKTKTHARQVR